MIKMSQLMQAQELVNELRLVREYLQSIGDAQAEAYSKVHVNWPGLGMNYSRSFNDAPKIVAGILEHFKDREALLSERLRDLCVEVEPVREREPADPF